MARKNPANKKHVPKKRATKVALAKSVAPVPVVEELLLPSAIELTKQSAKTLWERKKLFGIILGVYGLLFLIFVQGLRGGTDVVGFRDQYANPAVGSVATFVQLVGTSTLSSSAGSGVYQLFLFVFVSLALIWALQQVKDGLQPRARDAYYKGMSSIIPFMLVMGVIFLQVLPMTVGFGAYETVVSSGVSATVIERIVMGALVAGLTLLSFFFIASSLGALYVVAQKEQTPVAALRESRRLVKTHRWNILRKILFLFFAALIVLAVVVTPIILLVPVIAEMVLVVVSILLLAFIHTYLFNLYRGVKYV